VCGICGLAGFENRPLLERMTSAIEHRGPDSSGFYISPEASLGFRRLSIIDLETGDQPIANEDGSVRVVLNGEIYNYRQLRQELERRGHRFSTAGDAETVVHLYEDDGEALLARLQGMFAFGLWDARRKRLLLARDRLGIKPLHYRQDGRRLAFASESKALLVDPDFPRRLNRQAADRLLNYLYLPGTDTLIEGVKRVPPGCWLRWEDGRVEIGRYWEPSLKPTRGVSESEAVAEFRTRFREAVESHLVSDVPVGALLSGGLDSAGVVAQMAELLDRKPKTFTVGFAGAEDERPLARRLAERFGTEHHEFELDPSRFAADLPRLIWHLEEPTPISFLPHFYLSEFARRHVKVALIGEGADELAQRIRRPRRVGVGEGDDLARSLADGAVLCCDLAAALAGEEAHATLAEGAHEVVRAIGRGVGGDDDFQPLARVVERQQVLEPPLDDRLLIVSGDDHADRRLDLGPAHAPLPQPRERGGGERVGEVRPREPCEREPKDELEDQHGAMIPRCRARSATLSSQSSSTSRA